MAQRAAGKIWGLFILLAACDERAPAVTDSATEPGPQVETTKSVAAPPARAVARQVEERGRADAASLAARSIPRDEGAALQDALVWSDSAGENALVFERTETKIPANPDEFIGEATTFVMTATHWRRGPDKRAWERVRRMREVVEACQLDSIAQVRTGPWSLTDLDEDGLSEASFVWYSGCKGDISPWVMKVLMMEDGEKYGLRGETAICLKKCPEATMGYEMEKGGPPEERGDVIGGGYRVGAAMRQAPAPFLRHARVVWDYLIIAPEESE